MASDMSRALDACAAAQQALSKSWGDILAVFDTLLTTVKECNVPRVLVQV